MDLKFAFRTLIHPYDSFWDIKFEKKGKLSTATLFIFLYFIYTIIDRQGAAFLYNNDYNTPMDMWNMIVMVALPVGLFVLANWAITTLMDGKGTAKDIYMVVGYSIPPLFLVGIPTTILTHALTSDDAAYVSFLETGALIWMALLVFIGIQTVHQYSVSKTVATFLLTILSAAVIIFIALLFFALLQEITGFVYSIYKELTLRL